MVRVAAHERRGEIDRYRACTGDRIGPLARVQAERVELERSGCGHGVLLGVRPILAVGTLSKTKKPRLEGRGFDSEKPRRHGAVAISARADQPSRIGT